MFVINYFFQETFGPKFDCHRGYVNDYWIQGQALPGEHFEHELISAIINKECKNYR